MGESEESSGETDRHRERQVRQTGGRSDRLTGESHRGRGAQHGLRRSNHSSQRVTQSVEPRAPLLRFVLKTHTNTNTCNPVVLRLSIWILETMLLFSESESESESEKLYCQVRFYTYEEFVVVMLVHASNNY